MEQQPSEQKHWSPPTPLTGNILGFGRIGCLDEDTEVFVMENNKVLKKKLKDFNSNETILSFNFITNKIEPTNALKVDTKDKECYEIEFNNGTKIIASEEHIFFDKNKNEIKTSNLKKNDLLCYSDCNIKNRNTWSNKNTINKILKTKLIKTKTKYPKKVYIEIKKLAKKGYSTVKIAKQLNIKHYRYIYNIARLYDDLKLVNRLQLNARKTWADWNREYRTTKQNYAYMKGNNNVSKRPDIRARLSITSSGSNNGMFGKHQSKKSRKLMSKSHKGERNSMANPVHRETHRLKMATAEVREKIRVKLNGELNPSFGKVYYPKFKYNKILKHSVRSNWEKEVCLYLLKNNINYEYEPEHYKLIVNNKSCTYTPDMKVNNKNVEVKGPLFDWQIAKMREFIKNNDLIIITNPKNFKNLQGFKLYDYNKFINGGYDLNEIFKN